MYVRYQDISVCWWHNVGDVPSGETKTKSMSIDDCIDSLNYMEKRIIELEGKLRDIIDFADDCMLSINGVMGANSQKELDSYMEEFDKLYTRGINFGLPSFPE